MFTSYPQNYQSLYSQLIYRYEEAAESDITLFITDSTSDELIGVKKFYSTTTAQLNIAPIIRPYALPSVVVAESGFVEGSNAGAIEVAVSDDDDNATESRIFTLSLYDESEVGLLSVFEPLQRVISIGESDLLTLRVDASLPINVAQRQYLYGGESPIVEQDYSCEAKQSGVALFNFVAQELFDTAGDVLERIELEVTQGDEVVALVTYNVIDEPREPIRVAWISQRGSIEHYTFPAVAQRTVASDSTVELTLNSAFESFDVREALAHIVKAAKVWLWIDGEYCDATVGSDEVELSARAAFATVEIKLSYKG